MRRKKSQLQARLEILCKGRGWSLAALGRAAGMSRQSLNALLARNNPRVNQLKRLADALGIPSEELIREVSPREYGAAMLRH